MTISKMLCTVYQLGQVGYNEAYQLQRELLCRRVEGKIEDTLLIMEHPPVITIGKSGKLENVLASQTELAKKGIPLLFVDRGGDVTYHGPGQLVGYPIIDLGNRERDLHQYVWELEEVVIRTLSDFDIKAERDRAHRGVWAGNEEVAAIGLRVRKWVTMHGFALNVSTDLGSFSLINPCGFSDRRATSMSKLLSQDVSMTTVTESLLAHFSEVFDVQLEWDSDNLNEKILKEKYIGQGATHGSQTTILV